MLGAGNGLLLVNSEHCNFCAFDVYFRQKRNGASPPNGPAPMLTFTMSQRTDGSVAVTLLEQLLGAFSLCLPDLSSPDEERFRGEPQAGARPGDEEPVAHER
jgi:hypothetical protein